MLTMKAIIAESQQPFVKAHIAPNRKAQPLNLPLYVSLELLIELLLLGLSFLVL